MGCDYYPFNKTGVHGMTQLFIAGLIGGLTGHLIAFSLKSVYYWFSDKYIDIGSPWDGEQIQSDKNNSKR